MAARKRPVQTDVKKRSFPPTERSFPLTEWDEPRMPWPKDYFGVEALHGSPLGRARRDSPVIRSRGGLTEPRTCCRCGAEFGAVERQRVCWTCRRPRRAPKVYKGKPLGPRERQVIGLVAKGLPNKLIAADLHLTEGTVKVYLAHIFEKAKVGNRTELAVWWLSKSREQAPSVEHSQ